MKNSLLLDHLSLRVEEALGVHGVLIQGVQQLQGVEDPLVGVVLVQRLFAFVDLTHVLQKTKTATFKRIVLYWT